MEPTKGLGLLLLLLIAYSLWRAHKNPAVEINAFDLLMDNGRISRIACMALGAFALTSWIMADLQVNGKMTEGYLTLYGGMWAAPLLAKLFAPAQPKE